MPRTRSILVAALSALALGVCTMPATAAVTLKNETYTLPNGMTVVLHEDHRLPQVVIDTWFGVGSKDEQAGRSGFAHLFEHLMFMGTKRVPGNQFDTLMEAQGASNNASTSTDRTNYFSVGPPSSLPLLLWLDADRLEGLGAAMTKEKVDLQRDVVRNERRQNVENTPYGIAELILPEALYPADHPYHHSVIGSHEDLEAATLADVKDFFATYYVPGNATLVVAGDFAPEKVKEVVRDTFGAIPARPLPPHRTAQPARLEHEVRRLAVDKVEFPKLYLVWPAPRVFEPGTAELDLLAGILGGSPSSRLERRLVQDLRIAQQVDVYLDERALGSEFHVEITAAPGVDLERIKHETLAALEALEKDGVTDAELARVKAQEESRKLNALENLQHRAYLMNIWHTYLGVADGFERDMERYRAATVAGVTEQARRTLGEGRVDLRIVPAGATVPEASLDRKPAEFPPAKFVPPVPESFRLANGLEVLFVPQRGTGLFAAHLVVDGGERAVPADKAGLATLTATLLTSGAKGKSTPEFAQAVEALGGAIDASAMHDALDVSVRGLASRVEPTLDLFADAVLEPNLAETDFRREADLQLARIRARVDEPREVASIVAARHVFGADSYRGRPTEGNADTVSKLTLADVKAAYPRLVNPSRARLVFVGDVDAAALRRVLDARLGAWKAKNAEPVPPRPAPLTKAEARLLLVDRPGAPQTMILAQAPLTVPDDAQRAVRLALNTAFGGSFTSRLNQNLREKHGYTYGAGTRIAQDGDQPYLRIGTAVQTKVTGPAMVEIRRELDGIAKGDVSADELTKARTSARYDLVEAVQTTGALSATLAGAVEQGRPPDSLRRLVDGLDRLTLDGTNAAARSGLFAWNGLVVVLVGDRKQVTEQLEKAGFPAPQLVDPDGRPVK